MWWRAAQFFMRHAIGTKARCRKDCPDKGSCDSSWGFNGANTYKALYLWWYGYYASNTTSTLKTMALDDAQYVIDHRFKTNPNLRVR